MFEAIESGGGDDESVYPLRNRLQEIGLTEAFPPILVKEAPTEAMMQLCDEAGIDLGQWLTRDRTVKQMKSLDNDLDKALGRLSGGLYIFANRGVTRLKLLWFDRNGLCQLYKRLHRAVFELPVARDGVRAVRIDRAAVATLLTGVERPRRPRRARGPTLH